MAVESAEKPLIYRPAGRVILLDQQDRILLFHFVARHLPRPVWITPGGGLKAGETFEQGAARELREETGLECDLGPCVWSRRYVLEADGRRIDMDQRFFVVRCSSFEPSRDGWEAEEHDMLDAHRWWAVDEMVASSEHFAPAAIASLLPRIIAADYPDLPIDCGI